MLPEGLQVMYPKPPIARRWPPGNNARIARIVNDPEEKVAESFISRNRKTPRGNVFIAAGYMTIFVLR